MEPLRNFRTKSEAVDYYCRRTRMTEQEAVEFVNKCWEVTR